MYDILVLDIARSKGTEPDGYIQHKRIKREHQGPRDILQRWGFCSSTFTSVSRIVIEQGGYDYIPSISGLLCDGVGAVIGTGILLVISTGIRVMKTKNREGK